MELFFQTEFGFAHRAIDNAKKHQEEKKTRLNHYEWIHFQRHILHLGTADFVQYTAEIATARQNNQYGLAMYQSNAH